MLPKDALCQPEVTQAHRAVLASLLVDVSMPGQHLTPPGNGKDMLALKPESTEET